jgi:hypothetical protein
MMSEVKDKIKKMITNVPDEALKVVLKYLESYQSVEDKKKTNNLVKILNEDSKLLDKLAQ